jgi:glycosyltransferase involved in cell wall biosynthesis
MKVIVCTRDLDYGVGSIVKAELKKMDADRNVNKVLVIGPKKLEGFSRKVIFFVIENCGSLFITKEPNYALKCNRAIKQILNEEKYDQVYLHFPICAENYGASMTTKFHGLHKSIIRNYPSSLKFFVGSIFHRLYSYFDYLTIKHSDKVFFVSRRTMGEAEIFYPQFKDKFEYSPNEADKMKFYRLSKKEKQKLKEEFGLNDGKFNLLYVGRLEPLKGILELIGVLEEIGNPQLRLIAIGDGPLKNEIAKYSFVKPLGKISNDELYKYYNIADLFVLPSFYENSPVTILEANACGCNILARDVGDNKYDLSKKQIFSTRSDMKTILERFEK